jgi:hypothetical protein
MTDNMMERARAARALLKDARKHDWPDQAEHEMAAFMAIFHPDRQLPEGERYTDPPAKGRT